MGPNVHNWAVNIFFLIGLLLVLAVGVILLIALLMGFKLWRWNRAERRARNAHLRERYRPNGEPYPPAARGICDRCGHVSEKVYHLPTGQRLCPYDYDVLYPPGDVDAGSRPPEALA